MEGLGRRRRVRWLVLRALVSALVLLGLQLVTRPAHAYVWMIRHGFAECGGCHVDPMGGETLTGMKLEFSGRFPPQAGNQRVSFSIDSINSGP